MSRSGPKCGGELYQSRKYAEDGADRREYAKRSSQSSASIVSVRRTAPHRQEVSERRGSQREDVRLGLRGRQALEERAHVPIGIMAVCLGRLDNAEKCSAGLCSARTA